MVYKTDNNISQIFNEKTSGTSQIPLLVSHVSLSLPLSCEEKMQGKDVNIKQSRNHDFCELKSVIRRTAAQLDQQSVVFFNVYIPTIQNVKYEICDNYNL